MWLIYLTSIAVPEHMNAFVLFWHEMKNSFVAEIGRLNTTQCMSDTRMAVVHSELLYNPPCCLGC